MIEALASNKRKLNADALKARDIVWSDLKRLK